MPRRLRSLLVVCLIASMIPGCGDDSSGGQGPVDDGVVNFPAEAATLQAAIDRAGEDGVVEVAAGTHVIDEEIALPAGVENVTVRGEAGSRPTLSFTLAAGFDDAISVQGSGATLRNLEITGTFRIGVMILTSGVSVVDCVIRDAAWYSVSCGAPTVDATIQGNILESAGLFAVHVVNGADPLVENNTIVDAGDCGIYTAAATPVCRNNIIAGSANWGIACFSAPPPGITLECNVLYNSATGHYSPECPSAPTDLDADPMFCETESYTLLVGSPCAAAKAGACGAIGAVEDICALAPGP